MSGDGLRRGVAEFIGAFALTFVGVGAIAVGAGLVGVALAHGLVIAVMASAVGHISGGHFNPAVTFGFLVTGRMALPLAVVYWVAQFAGAVLAAVLLTGLLPNSLTDPVNLGAPAIAGGIGAGAGLVLEAILTFFLVWVIFATAADERGTFKSIAGLAIGFAITLDILFAGPLTGAAMNPARAFGPSWSAVTGQTGGFGTSGRSSARRRQPSFTSTSTFVRSVLSRWFPGDGARRASARRDSGFLGRLEGRLENLPSLSDGLRRDRMVDGILVIADVEAGFCEAVACVPPPLDPDDRVVRPMRDRDR